MMARKKNYISAIAGGIGLLFGAFYFGNDVGLLHNAVSQDGARVSEDLTLFFIGTALLANSGVL